MSGRPLTLGELVTLCRKTYQTDFKYSEAIDIAAKADEHSPLIATQLLAEVYAAWYHHLKTKEYRLLFHISKQHHLQCAHKAEKFRRLADEIWRRNNGLESAWENHDAKSDEIYQKIQDAIMLAARRDIEDNVRTRLELLFPGNEIVVITREGQRRTSVYRV